MRLKNLQGKAVYKNYEKYRIDWKKKTRSKYQDEVKKFLRKYIDNHVVYEEFFIPGSKMSLDLFDATDMVAYEMQGEFHTGYSKFGHKGSRMNYVSQLKRDGQKENWCNMNGITYVEIFPEDLPLTKKFFEDKYGILFYERN